MPGERSLALAYRCNRL